MDSERDELMKKLDNLQTENDKLKEVMSLNNSENKLETENKTSS